MSYPRVPVIPTQDSARKFGGAINHLLGRMSYIHLEIAGKPAAGQVILSTQFPVALTVVPTGGLFKAKVGATAAPAFTITVDGVMAGSIPFTGTDGTLGLGFEVPAATPFEVIAPTPQDATLSDITLSLAVSR